MYQSMSYENNFMHVLKRTYAVSIKNTHNIAIFICSELGTLKVVVKTMFSIQIRERNCERFPKMSLFI